MRDLVSAVTAACYVLRKSSSLMQIVMLGIALLYCKLLVCLENQMVRSKTPAGCLVSLIILEILTEYPCDL